MKHKQRPTIFYDWFRGLMESGNWLPPEVSRNRHVYKSVMQSAMSYLTTAQIRVLTPDVVRMALDLANKAGKTPVPYVSYPRYPSWVEFDENIGIGDQNAQYRAIWAIPAPNREKTIQFDLLTEQGQAKSLFVREDGAWDYEQIGMCRHAHTCERARHTVEEKPYDVSSTEIANLLAIDCQCAGAGWQWAQFIFIIGHLLRMPRTEIKESVTTRALPLPKNFHDRQRVEAENKKYPRYVTLSLSHPFEVHAARSTAKQTTPPALPATYLETQQVAGSWRTLIPGEGKPWRELQIFYVESYERGGQQADTATRYIIEP